MKKLSKKASILDVTEEPPTLPLLDIAYQSMIMCETIFDVCISRVIQLDFEKSVVTKIRPFGCNWYLHNFEQAIVLDHCQNDKRKDLECDVNDSEEPLAAIVDVCGADGDLATRQPNFTANKPVSQLFVKTKSVISGRRSSADGRSTAMSRRLQRVKKPQKDET
jgi:hypothetical protein